MDLSISDHVPCETEMTSWLELQRMEPAAGVGPVARALETVWGGWGEHREGPQRTQRTSFPIPSLKTSMSAFETQELESSSPHVPTATSFWVQKNQIQQPHVSGQPGSECTAFSILSAEVAMLFIISDAFRQ